MKKIIFLLLFFAPVFCPGQVLTSFKTVVYPGTDFPMIFADTITISINQEAGTVDINIRNGESQFSRNDTMIMVYKGDNGLTVQNGKCSYTISAVATGGKSKTYFLKGPIHCIEIFNDHCLISFSKYPAEPIKLIDLKK